MAITYVGGDFVDGGDTANDITPSFANCGTIAAGDFALMHCRADESGTIPDFTLSTGTTGWTELFDINATSGTDSVETVFYKANISASESDPTVEISISQQHAVTLTVWRGVDTTTPFDVTWNQTNHWGDTANNQTGPNPAITTNTDGAMVVLGHGITTSSDSFANGAAGAPSGYTLSESNGGPRVSTAGAYKIVATAGTETPGVWTHTGDGIGGGSEERMFTLALKPAAGGTDAPGQLAEADAIGYNAATQIDVTAGTDSITATANQAKGSVGANGQQAAVTATANNASVTTTTGTETATATTTAYNASTAIAPTGGQAAATATANNATVDTATSTNAPGQLASTTATAYNAATAIAPTAQQAASTVTAYNATTLTGVTADGEQAAATATANNASTAIAPAAQQAAATGTAYNASVTTSSATNAPGELATATATAYNATVTTSTATNAPGEVANATATAYNASTQVATDAQSATATATANNATVTTQAATNAPGQLAAATATAYDASTQTTTGTDTASATATAYNATISIGIKAELAEGTTIAYGATVALDVNAETANATVFTYQAAGPTPIIRVAVAHHAILAPKRQDAHLAPKRHNAQLERVAMRTIESTTAHYIGVYVHTTSDPTGGNVDFALTATTTQPTSWQTGTWSGTFDATTGRVLALTPLTGASQTLDVTPDTDYDLWARWTVGAETPVQHVDKIRVT